MWSAVCPCEFWFCGGSLLKFIRKSRDRKVVSFDQSKSTTQGANFSCLRFLLINFNFVSTGKTFSYSDPETSSDSEEDALRRLNSHSHPPPDTLTIQAEDGPTILGKSRSFSNNPSFSNLRFYFQTPEQPPAAAPRNTRPVTNNR